MGLIVETEAVAMTMGPSVVHGVQSVIMLAGNPHGYPSDLKFRCIRIWLPRLPLLLRWQWVAAHPPRLLRSLWAPLRSCC